MGATQTAKLKLPHKLVQLFKRTGKLPLTLTAVVHDPAGPPEAEP